MTARKTTPTVPKFAHYAEKEATPTMQAYAEWLTAQTGYAVDVKSVLLASWLRGEFQKSEERQSARESDAAAKVAAKEARAAKAAERTARAEQVAKEREEAAKERAAKKAEREAARIAKAKAVLAAAGEKAA